MLKESDTAKNGRQGSKKKQGAKFSPHQCPELTTTYIEENFQLISKKNSIKTND